MQPKGAVLESNYYEVRTYMALTNLHFRAILDGSVINEVLLSRYKYFTSTALSIDCRTSNGRRRFSSVMLNSHCATQRDKTGDVNWALCRRTKLRTVYGSHLRGTVKKVRSQYTGLPPKCDYFGSSYCCNRSRRKRISQKCSQSLRE